MWRGGDVADAVLAAGRVKEAPELGPSVRTHHYRLPVLPNYVCLEHSREGGGVEIWRQFQNDEFGEVVNPNHYIGPIRTRGRHVGSAIDAPNLSRAHCRQVAAKAGAAVEDSAL